MNFEHDTAPQSEVKVEKSEGDKKIEEYTSRILSGQNPTYVLDGLPESWVQKINEAVNSILDVSLNDIPPQYKGMNSEALEFIWADETNIPVRLDESEQDRSKEINRRKQIVGLLREGEKYIINPGKDTNIEKSTSTTLLNIDERKKLNGWEASYELAKIAKEQGVDLSKLSREEYAEYAIQNALAIHDSQLRVAPWQRNGLSVEEIVKTNKRESDGHKRRSRSSFFKVLFRYAKKGRRRRPIPFREYSSASGNKRFKLVVIFWH